MSYELGGDVLRAAQLAKNLSASEAHLRDTEQRMDMAVRGARCRPVEPRSRARGLVGVRNRHEGAWVRAGRKMGSRSLLRAVASGRSQDVGKRCRIGDLEGSGEFNTEYRIIGSDGRTRWIMVRGQVEFDAATRTPLRMRGIVSEITERRQAEERSAARRRNVADGAADGGRAGPDHARQPAGRNRVRLMRAKKWPV